MKVTGKIKNVVDFGAFVDIGLHETGLIHVSELSDTFVSDPMEVVKVGDIHEFTILELDTDRRRISLSLKSDAAGRAGTGQKSSSRPAAGSSSNGGKRVVVVKKGSAPRNDSQRQNRSYSRNDDDGMSYNPFAALLKK